MQSNRQHKGVLASMSVGRPEHVLAAVDHGGVLTLLGNHSVATRIFVVPLADGAVSDVSQPHALRYALMSVTREVQTELARGPMPEMEAMRKRLSRDMLANMRRGRGYRRILLMTVCGLVGMVLGAAVVLGTQPVPVGSMPPGMPPIMPGPMTAPQQQAHPTTAPAPQAPAPRTGSAMPDPTSFLGDVSTPSSPVSLDDPDAAPQALLPSVQVPAAPKPAPPVSASAPVAPNVPAAPLPPPHSAVAPSIPTAPAPVAPRADASPATMPQMAAAPAPQPIITQVDADKARRELTALKDAQDALRTGRHLSSQTLAALPPDIAQRFSKVAQANPAASSSPVTPASSAAPVASHDQYGIPTMPDKSSWAALGAVDVPLPGGGDIKSPEDMAKFGVK